VKAQKGEFRDVLERLAREGFVRARVDGALVELGNPDARVKLDAKQKHTLEAVVDRLVIEDKVRVRLADSVETALRWGEGVMRTLHQLPEERTVAQNTKFRVTAPSDPPGRLDAPDQWTETLHSNRMFSPATGGSFEPLTPKHFSFNAPAGACPVCHGLGQKLVFDEGLVVPDPDKSLEGGAVQPWRRGGKRMIVYLSLRTPDPWNWAEPFLLLPRTGVALKASKLRGQSGGTGSGRFLAYQGITLTGQEF